MFVHDKHYGIHAEELDPRARHFLLRGFPAPKGLWTIEAETGQPFCKFDATAVLSVSGQESWLKGMLRVPPRGLDPLVMLSRKLAISSMWYQRWIEETETKREPVDLLNLGSMVRRTSRK